MADRPVFGRRGNPQRRLPPAREISAPATQSVNAMSGDVAPEPLASAAEQPELPPLDRELREWKRARNRGFKIPWRPLALMASLCFGMASFVLPDAVNDAVQWPLYALMAMSFYAGISARRRKAKS